MPSVPVPWQFEINVLASPRRTALSRRKLCWTLPLSGSLPDRYPPQREVWLSMVQVLLSSKEELSCLLSSLFSSKKIENSMALLHHLPMIIYGDPTVPWVTGTIWSYSDSGLVSLNILLRPQNVYCDNFRLSLLRRLVWSKLNPNNEYWQMPRANPWFTRDFHLCYLI